MFSPAAVILVNRSPRQYLSVAFVRHRPNSKKKNPQKLETSNPTQQTRHNSKLQLSAKLVISPCFASQVFPPTPRLVLRGRVNDWLRTALLKCFRLLNIYGASSGTNYWRNNAGWVLPTQGLQLRSSSADIHSNPCLSIAILTSYQKPLFLKKCSSTVFNQNVSKAVSETNINQKKWFIKVNSTQI